MLKRYIVASLFMASMVASNVASACEPPRPHVDYLLVGNKGEDTISFIDLITGYEVAREKVSATAPHEIAVSPGGRFAAVVNYGDAVIDVFDIPFRSITASINLGENTRPHGLLALETGGFIATTEGNDSIVLLSPHHDYSKFGPGPCPSYDWNVRAISTGQSGTHMVAISPHERIAYTANMQSGTVSRIDLETQEVISAPAGKEVEGVAVTKDGSEVWASVRGEDKVVIFDATTLEQLSEIKVGKFPLRIIVSPDGKNMVTSNLLDGSLSVIDVMKRKVVRTIVLGGTRETAQVTLLFSEDGTTIYVAETGKNRIAEVDFLTGKTRRWISVGKQGDGLAIVPGTK